jgi:hypothetical protein
VRAALRGGDAWPDSGLNAPGALVPGAAAGLERAQRTLSSGELVELTKTRRSRQDAGVRGALHGIVLEDEVEQTDTPRFDGGPRIDPDATRSRTRTELALDGVFGPFPSNEPGWVEYEIENGAELLNRPMAD